MLMVLLREGSAHALQRARVQLADSALAGAKLPGDVHLAQAAIMDLSHDPEPLRIERL